MGTSSVDTTLVECRTLHEQVKNRVVAMRSFPPVSTPFIVGMHSQQLLSHRSASSHGSLFDCGILAEATMNANARSHKSTGVRSGVVIRRATIRGGARRQVKDDLGPVTSCSISGPSRKFYILAKKHTLEKYVKIFKKN
ncbi:hypothetical protein RND71_021867 [Anisodus tanguticus]|uniref:Uncharacterized protein n=1 Tax=Anisodus tanguticus TaxID=243964 RepID=A0AAE1RXC7_9SOLA|nr:hypothetical protein RND71_021867 [Anisodus tanguticus]